MASSPSSVLTRGLGSWGSSSLLLTRGLGSSSVVIVAGPFRVTAAQLHSPGGSTSQLHSPGCTDEPQSHVPGAAVTQFGQ